MPRTAAKVQPPEHDPVREDPNAQRPFDSIVPPQSGLVGLGGELVAVIGRNASASAGRKP
jgi:hypothetical protein